ncbi:MAG: flagellar hook-basal body complex protein FliE [Peptostreptococcaceae bacterium]|nr:flagellar hook-basal body complex protein FliE [Peptostreptococcaceae bacterium]
MFIKAMDPIRSLEQLNGSERSKPQTTESVFKDVFQKAIENVIETDKEVQKEQYLLATGQSDDLHDLTIASTKAQLSIDLMIQLRNRAMESYNEMMRINL